VSTGFAEHRNGECRGGEVIEGVSCGGHELKGSEPRARSVSPGCPRIQ
jgi:hypothetical protein